MKDSATKRLVVIALLIAVEVILTRFLSIRPTPAVRISFGFIPIAMMAAMYGPVYAGIGAAAADFIGAVLFPAGAFFPGFTATAFLTGAVYGLFFFGRPASLWRVCAAALVVTVVLQLGLDTLWLGIILGEGVFALLPARVARTLIMAPAQIICLRLTQKLALQRFP